MRKLHYLIVGLLLLISSELSAQTKEVTGKVTDPAGNPVPGASIRIKGLKKGTSAETNGEFKITTPENAILIISGVGFEPVEISVKDRTTVTIALKSNNTALSEVVVTALGIKREKKALGYAVATVD